MLISAKKRKHIHSLDARLHPRLISIRLGLLVALSLGIGLTRPAAAGSLDLAPLADGDDAGYLIGVIARQEIAGVFQVGAENVELDTATIVLYRQGAGTPDGVVYKIYSNTAGLPVTQLCITEELPGSEMVQDTIETHELAFTEPCALEADEFYHLAVARTGATDETNRYAVRYRNNTAHDDELTQKIAGVWTSLGADKWLKGTVHWPEPPPPACGDGTVDEGESCDDGNLDNYDGCSATCTLPRTVLPEEPLFWVPLLTFILSAGLIIKLT